MAPGRVLVIAGSDCSGGAGLEADQKVIAAHGCYAMTATTALTAQNTQGVYDIHQVPPPFLRKQVDACFDDIGVDVVKTGMLASTETIGVVAECLSRRHQQQQQQQHDDEEGNKGGGEVLEKDGGGGGGGVGGGYLRVVLDPVMIATTGAALLPSSALRELRTRLFPLATVVTPNVPEARLLLTDAGESGGAEGVSSSSAGGGGGGGGSGGGSWPVESVGDLERMARCLLSLGPGGRGGKEGPRWVLVKGGHTPFRRSDLRVASSQEEKQVVVDVLAGKGEDGGAEQVVRIETEWMESRNTHGTGCSLASAIASHLAKGVDVPQAVRLACRYVRAGIETAPGFGKGSGPLNHFHSTFTLPFYPGHFVEWMLERPDVAPVWDRFVNHPFVMAMGDGSLPLESFKGYLVQDYLYLMQFARANALAAYKSKSMADIAAASGIVLHIERETNLHLAYCKGFGISREEMEQTEEKMACTAYTRYVLDIGQSEDWLGLQVALAPCLLGYGALAKMLHGHPKSKRDGNTYWDWIENYVAEDYAQAVDTGSRLLEKHAAKQSPSRIEELVKIFIHATKMEIGFWEMFPYK